MKLSIPLLPSVSIRRVLAIFSLVLLGLARNSPAAIDLTPFPEERTLEGIVFKQLTFHQPGGRISYRYPVGWNFSGDSNTVRLTPPDLMQANAEIKQVRLPAPQPLDEATVKLLHEEALHSVPPGSQQVVVLAEEQNAIQINLQPTYGVTLEYVLRGQQFQCNFLFANMGDTQLRFRVVATKAEFPAVFQAFRGSLFTFQWQ